MGRADMAWKCDTVHVRCMETGAACGSDDWKVKWRMAPHPSLDWVDFGGIGTSGIPSIE